jgi:hypothetical protein
MSADAGRRNCRIWLFARAGRLVQTVVVTFSSSTRDDGIIEATVDIPRAILNHALADASSSRALLGTTCSTLSTFRMERGET